MKLYQREGCPFCTAVRQFMTENRIDFEVVNVAKLASERKQLLAMAGLESAEIPVLEDGESTIQGSDAIVEHLGRALPPHPFGDPSYGLTRNLPGMSYADAVVAAKAALAAEGFGVLTEIDVRATMKAKLDAEMPNYIILGACNPPLALRALTALPAVGLLLPCNVVVTESADGDAIVSAIDPRKMFSVVDQAGLEEVVRDVGKRLRRALAAI